MEKGFNIKNSVKYILSAFGYFLLLFAITKNYRDVTSVAILDWLNSPVYLSRPLWYFCVLFDFYQPVYAFGVFSLVYGLDAAILQHYLEKRMTRDRAITSALLFLFSASIFYSRGNYGVAQMPDSVVYLLVLVSLEIYDKNKNAALVFQIFTVFYKETIPLLIISWYFLDSKTSLVEILRGLRKDARAVSIAVTVAGIYIVMRVIVTLKNPSGVWGNPFAASTIYWFFTNDVNIMVLLGMGFKIFITFNIVWLGTLALPRHKDILLLFLVQVTFFLAFGYIWECNKLFVLFPFQILLFWEVFDEKFTKGG